jgi:signal transduction histidine kinase
VAHEVRNPLNNINLSVENMIQQATNEEDKIYLEIIKRNGKRINDLITELLQSSIPAEMDFQPVSISSIIENVINAVQDRVLLRKIRICFNHPDNDCLIQADGPKLEMALLNIVTNAIEAVPDGTGLIEITTHFKSDGFVVCISDNGCGMNQETKAKLFEPYFTSKRNGLGVGLATSLTILNAHNATIEVNSQENNGTTFRLIFKT